MGLRIAAAAVGLAVIAGCALKAETSDPVPEPAQSTFTVVEPAPEPVAMPEEIDAGRLIFAGLCATCHGRSEGVRGIAISRRDYAGVREIITRGTIVYGGNMPAWTGILAPDQIDDVAKYIVAGRPG